MVYLISTTLALSPLTMSIVSSSEVLCTSSLPESPFPVRILKRIPRASRFHTATKLASILDNIVAEVGGGGIHSCQSSSILLDKPALEGSCPASSKTQQNKFLTKIEN